MPAGAYALPGGHHSCQCATKYIASSTLSTGAEAYFSLNRVGDGIAPVALSHHRTCGSAYGGSLNMLEASLGVQQRNQPEFVKEAFWIGRVHVACSGVPPWTASVACRFPCSRFIQSSRL